MNEWTWQQTMRKCLLNNDELKNWVKGIFPLYVPENTDFPFIVYMTTNMFTQSDKDVRYHSFNISFSLSIVCLRYPDLKKYTEIVNDTLLQEFGKYCKNFSLDGMSEDVDTDTNQPVYYSVMSYSFNL